MAKVQLKDVRLTFPVLFEAKQVNGKGDPKYSAAFLIPRDHPQLTEIQNAIREAANAEWGDKSAAIVKQLGAGDRLAVHDGDGKSDYDGYAGNYFINASNKVRPLVIDGNRAPLTVADGKPYSGCYVNAIVEFWGQDNEYGKRVNASLLGVQFVRDGERLAGGAVAAADDFEAIPDAAAPQTAKDGAAGLFGA